MKLFQRFFVTFFFFVFIITILTYVVQDRFFRIQQDNEAQKIDYHLRNVRLYIDGFEKPLYDFLDHNNLELITYSYDENNDVIAYSIQGKVSDDVKLTRLFATKEEIIAKCKLAASSENGVTRETIKRANGDYILQYFCDDNDVHVLVSPFTQYQTVIKILQQSYVITLISTIFITIIFSYIQAQYFSKQILEISKVTRALSNLNFDNKVETSGNDELAELGKNINILSGKLHFSIAKLKETIAYEQDAKEKQSQMFASMSHELKTPITILKGTLEGIKDQIGPYKNPLNYTDDMIEEVNNMENIVMNLLNYARFSNNATPFVFKKVSLRLLINKEIERLSYLIDEKNLELDVKLVDDEVVVDVTSIQVVLKNIIENAIFYSNVDAKVEILATSFSNHVLVQVINHGTNMNETSKNVIFEPFYREEESRLKYKNGTGLGLTIVKQILEQHNSTFSLYNINDDDEFAVCFEFTLSTNNDNISK